MFATLDRSRKNVLLLALALALGMSATSLVMTTAAVVGYSLAIDKTLATLPVASAFVAMLLISMPASYLMKRVGRRPGFLFGTALGMVGAAVCVVAIYQASFWLFTTGTFFMGASTMFVQFYRFAAAETAPPEFKATAISLVMAGGVLSALIGPNLANFAKDWLSPMTFAGSFAAVILLQSLAAALLVFVDIPQSRAERHGTPKPLGQLARQPAFIVANIAGMFGYAIMTFMMTVSPLAVIACGYGFAEGAFVIQWHVLGMFVPSFFTGRLIKRYGVLPIILIGQVLYAATVVIAVSGQDLMLNFWPALVLLGVGWNFTFIGSTTLLTETYGPADKAKAEGLNSVLVQSMVAAAGLGSGVVHTTLGWSGIALLCIPAILLITLSVIMLMGQRRRLAPATGG